VSGLLDELVRAGLLYPVVYLTLDLLVCMQDYQVQHLLGEHYVPELNWLLSLLHFSGDCPVLGPQVICCCSPPGGRHISPDNIPGLCAPILVSWNENRKICDN